MKHCISKHINKTLIIGGPTSSGKTTLSVKCAKKYGGEVVGADSRHVYKGLNIGTGKIREKEKQGVPHHMIDIVDPQNVYNAFRFAQDAYQCIQDIQHRGNVPIVAGGSGFYIHALRYINAIECVTPETKTCGEERHLTERFPHIYIVLSPEKKKLERDIEQRLQERWGGIIEECITLHTTGLSYQRMEDIGLEYRFVSQLLQGHYTEEHAYKELLLAIKHYAKRQRTWFKKYGGVHIKTPQEAVRYLETYYL